jgi:Phage capsid family.
MTKKEQIQMRNRIKEIDARIKTLADTLETEKRSLTKDETEERDAIVSEKQILQLRYEMAKRGETLTEQEISNERSFDNIVTSIVRRRDLGEEYATIVTDNTIEIPFTRAFQDTTAASPIIPLTIGEIIQPLEKGLILDSVGCKMQYGLTGDWVLPVVAGIEATIEDENAEVSDQTIDIGSLKPVPKRVSMSIPVSNTAIDQSNNILLEIVRTQMTMGLTRLLNRWMFNPSKITAKASNGCFVAPKATMVTDAYSYKDITSLRGRVMKKGVKFDGTAAYVCTATTYADLEATPRAAGGERMIIENGKIDGYPVFSTEYVADGMLGFGVFAYELVGQFGQMRLIVDPYTGSKKNLTYFVLNTSFDMLSVRTEAFGVCNVSAIAAIASDPTNVELKSVASIPATFDINVTGVVLTTAIGAALTGTDAAKFSLSAASLAKDADGKVNSKLTVTYTPTAAGKHSATLTLSATGATSVTVDLTGICK